MKKIFLLAFLLFFAFSNIQAQSIELPNACRKILDKNYRGWKLAAIQKEISDYHRGNNFPYQPNLVKGDWNGDGKIDYAALIEHGKLKNSEGESIDDRRLMIAFVRAANGYKYFSFDGADSINLMKKGSKDYDYETNKTFRYKTDAIFVGHWEKGGVSYIWKNKKFIMIVTSD